MISQSRRQFLKTFFLAPFAAAGLKRSFQEESVPAAFPVPGDIIRFEDYQVEQIGPVYSAPLYPRGYRSYTFLLDDHSFKS